LDKIGVLIVDDHVLLREGIKKILHLDDQIEIVDAVSSGEKALELLETTQPDIVLLDLNLPGISGVEACKKIKSQYPLVNVIALTIYEEESYVFEIIKAGGSGYLLKDVSPDVLIKAIKDVYDGKSLLHPNITSKVFNEFNRLNQLADQVHRTRLTERETEVLRLVSTGNSNKEIAAKLFISEKTVKNHIANMFQKLEVADRTEAVVKAMKQKMI
jgi:two-component system response regulator DegU